MEDLMADSVYVNMSDGSKIRKKLNENGFVVIRGFLKPSEADELRLAGEILEKTRPKEQTSYFSTKDIDLQYRDDYFLGSNDKIRYFLEPKVNDKGEAKLSKVGHALHLLHPLFRRYTYDNRVKEACKNLGMNDPIVVQSMYIYKSAYSGGEVKPHQDASYLSTEPETAIGFWIPLNDATLDNGCLWAEKGSHKGDVKTRLKRNPDKSSDKLLIYDRPTPSFESSVFTPLPMSKGDCILIHGKVVHKSCENNSKFDRPAYTFHVVEKGAKFSEENWLQEGPSAPFVSLYTTD